jgi:uncharacterized protein involved in outer membrane biogenesis
MRIRRWLWIPLVGLGLLLLFIAGPGAESINTLVHSDAFRHEVEARASASAGSPVTIKEIGFSLWSGVELHGLATKVATPQGTVALEVESVNCSYSWLALLHRELKLEQVTVEKPQIVLTQQPPSAVPTPTAGAKEPAAPPTSSKGPPLQVVLESAKISDGHLMIHDATGAMKADLQGFDVHADTAGYFDGGDVAGTMSIAKVVLPKNLTITDFSTPFKGRAGAMEADPFEAGAFGGKITGHYHLEPGSPSTLDIAAANLDVAKISKTAKPDAPAVLQGDLSLQSTWHGAETGTLTGAGDAQITHGRLQGVAMLNNLASALHIRGLADPQLKTVTTHFEVAQGTTHFSALQIEAADFELTGEGTIDPAGKLDARMVLTLHGGAMGGVTGAAAALISRGGSIPIHLTGTVSDPHTNLNPQFFNPGTKVQSAVDKAIKHLF